MKNSDKTKTRSCGLSRCEFVDVGGRAVGDITKFYRAGYSIM